MRKNVTPEQEHEGWGDVWTWTAIDADSKLCVTYYVGDRGKLSALSMRRFTRLTKGFSKKVENHEQRE